MRNSEETWNALPEDSPKGVFERILRDHHRLTDYEAEEAHRLFERHIGQPQVFKTTVENDAHLSGRAKRQILAAFEAYRETLALGSH